MAVLIASVIPPTYAIPVPTLETLIQAAGMRRNGANKSTTRHRVAGHHVTVIWEWSGYYVATVRDASGRVLRTARALSYERAKAEAEG